LRESQKGRRKGEEKLTQKPRRRREELKSSELANPCVKIAPSAGYGGNAPSGEVDGTSGGGKKKKKKEHQLDAF